jgi:hypothetical protein
MKFRKVVMGLRHGCPAMSTIRVPAPDKSARVILLGHRFFRMSLNALGFSSGWNVVVVRFSGRA